MALQELCLTTIGRSLERFCCAYSATDDNDLLQRFRFLQKFYGSRLISWIDIDKEDLLPDSYADLLFSKYLKSVDTSWFLRFSWKAIFDTFARIGPDLENVVFYEDSKSLWPALFNRDSNSIHTKSIICYLPNAKAITYQRFCNNSMLESIAKYCRKLEILDVKHSDNVSNDGLKYFYQKDQGNVPCPLLREIILQSVWDVSAETIKHLFINLPLLEKLDHDSLPLAFYLLYKNDASLNEAERCNLKYLSLLQYVDMSHTEAYDVFIKICIPLCPKLKTLYCSLFSLEHSDLCCTLHNVEDLYLDCINSTSVDVNDVLKKMGGKLTSLTLSNCSVSLSVLGQRCHNLDHLTLNAVNIEYNENDPCSVFSNLKTLKIKRVDLSNPSYSKAACRILECSSTLENLYLKKCKSLSSELKTEILKYCEQYALKLIHFYHCSVDAHFIKNIFLACSTLEIFKSDVIDRYSHLYSTAWSLPNEPDTTLCSESSARDYFSDSSVDWRQVEEEEDDGGAVYFAGHHF